jgi:indolepyruvate ferredoxin oxidoreductase
MMSGVHALVRVVIDQMRADNAEASDTRAFISGYPGSPLGGLDLELGRQRALLNELGVVHQPALNEELGAMAVAGTQLVSTLPDPSVKGVVGVWYGKAPGVDRAGDALRHANLIGAHPHGGAVAICGDDPGCKSSTIPSASEASLAAMRIPVLYPGTPAEVLRFGRDAIAISRASGLWVALKVVANVADASATVDLGVDEAAHAAGRAEAALEHTVHRPSGVVLPPVSLELERSLMTQRLDAAVACARALRVDRLPRDPDEAQIGLIASGAVYGELREALATLGVSLDEPDSPIRILKPGLLWPLDRELVRRFARDLRTVVVIEEKGPFMEAAVRAALYDTASRPRIIGERDEHDGPLIPGYGTVDADLIADALRSRLPAQSLLPHPRRAAMTPAASVQLPMRTPFFCSGCPHNSSTVVPDGAVVGAGIGCHGMLAIQGSGLGPVSGITPMGLEGSQWIGQSPFTATQHIFQNLGDGTFSHSGSLAIRAAVAAGVNITYKLLYNDAVSMTGGQAVPGQMSVPELVRWLDAAGVARIIVTTDAPERYDGVTLAGGVRVLHRREIMAAQHELQQVRGVTVLVHDQGCAAEKRRLRKRGTLPAPAHRAFINARVCEACGDCRRKSACLSLVSQDTEFGVKTQVQQSSCNQDLSCVDGDCPSFVQITGELAATAAPQPPPDLPEPTLPALESLWTVRLMGIGGTGVVTISQVLAVAAHIDGNRAVGLDQTGLAQKGGPVISDVRFAAGPTARSARASAGSVDAYIAFDLLGALNPANLRLATDERTTAIVSVSQVQTGQMVLGGSERFPDLDDAMRRIDAATRATANVYLDATAIAEQLFGDHVLANSIVVGAAWQRGVIPASRDAIAEAYRLNGVAVSENLAAFEWGRAIVARPDAVAHAQATSGEPPPQISSRATAIVDRLSIDAESELGRLVALRVDDLIGYQSRAYAARYAQTLAEVRRAAATCEPSRRDELTAAVARSLHKLMAYKDEYEVARLHLDPLERARIHRQFGPQAKVRYALHPPLLRALGLKRKVVLGNPFEGSFRVLRALRHVRGTPLDVFGHTEMRRTERALADEYVDAVRAALPHASARFDLVRELCEAPQEVRGYETIKLRAVATYRENSRRLLEQIIQQA